MNAERIVEDFNARFKIGDKVTLILDNGDAQKVTIKHQANINPAGIPVGWFDGIRGAYLLARIKEIDIDTVDRSLPGWVRISEVVDNG